MTWCDDFGEPGCAPGIPRTLTSVAPLPLVAGSSGLPLPEGFRQLQVGAGPSPLTYLTWWAIGSCWQKPDARCSPEHMVSCTPAWCRHLLGLPGVWGGWLGCPRPQAKRPIHLHAGRLPRAWTMGRSDTACHCFEDRKIWRKLCLQRQSQRPPVWGACLGPARGTGTHKPPGAAAHRLHSIR